MVDNHDQIHEHAAEENKNEESFKSDGADVDDPHCDNTDSDLTRRVSESVDKHVT